MIHRALFVMTSKDHVTLKDGTQHPTGFYASEFVEPYDTFKQAGMQIDVATPDGRIRDLIDAARHAPTAQVPRGRVRPRLVYTAATLRSHSGVQERLGGPGGGWNEVESPFDDR